MCAKHCVETVSRHPGRVVPVTLACTDLGWSPEMPNNDTIWRLLLAPPLTMP